jgi:hypothetical protein
MAGHYLRDDSAVLAGSAFALGLVTGLVVKGVAKEAIEAVRRKAWKRSYERTVTYDDNLPDSLARREPPPEQGQPRYGGTGALGVHPDAVAPARSYPPDDVRRR